MHAVLHANSQERRKLSVSSDIPETIQEGQTLQTKQKDFDSTTDGEIIKTEEPPKPEEDSKSKGARSISEIAMSARFVGKVVMATKTGAVSDKGSVDEDSPPG